MKYLVVTGGVVSGLGKGISISSIGVLLKSCGLRVTSIKIDPYLNTDAGTMSPFEHGEVFVLDDGGEADLDLGNYERFLDVTLTRDHNITTGKVYSQVIAAERRGDYLGKTVQVIPHVTDAIQDWIQRVAVIPVDAATHAHSAASGMAVETDADGGAAAASASSSSSSSSAGAAGATASDTRPAKRRRMDADAAADAAGVGSSSSSSAASAGAASATVDVDEPDVCLVEVGGTVGDIESLVFLEALRQLQGRVGAENVCFVHVSLVPVLGSVGEQKTKPTQHSVKELRSVGLSPDILICRSTHALTASTRTKLGHSCQVHPDNVLTVHDVSNIYHVPLMLDAQGAAQIIAKRLNLALPFPAPRLTLWRGLAEGVDTVSKVVRIALVGKYTGLQDSYLSVIKALQHAAVAVDRKLVIDWIDAAALEPNTERTDPAAFTESWATVKAADGILVPGGFGDRGVEGKIAAISHARTSKTPFLGICLGMQCSVIEYARNVLGWNDANSAEFAPSAAHKVVMFMPEISTSHMGGTMRLGSRPTLLRGRPDGVISLAHDVYGRDVKLVKERHRHRYEVNPDHVAALQGAGLFFTGVDDKAQRMEIVELDRSVHPFYLAMQYHPEFQSHPFRPSPPFHGFLLAASGQLEGRLPLSSADRRAKGLSVGTGPVVPAAAVAHAAGHAAVGGAGTLTAPPSASRTRSASSSSDGSSLSTAAVIPSWERSPLRPIGVGASITAEKNAAGVMGGDCGVASARSDASATAGGLSLGPAASE